MGNVTSLGSTSLSAASRIEAGASVGVRYAFWKMGNAAFEQADFATALGHYHEAADLGLGLAHRSVGFMLSGGLGCPANAKAAAVSYVAAAEAGDGPAALQVGLAYVYGRGVGRDREAAIGWFERTAVAGVTLAKTHLALAKFNVLPLESAGQTLLRLVALSRETDDAAVHHAIGLAWLEGYPGWVDIDRAVSAFRYAADLGSNVSKLDLARLLLGSGNSADVNEAIRLSLSAAKAGVDDAAAELGTIFVAGAYGLPQELDYGIDWFEKAVAGGSLAGQVGLAKHLLSSEDKHDLKRAKGLLVQAVEERGLLTGANFPTVPPGPPAASFRPKSYPPAQPPPWPPAGSLRLPAGAVGCGLASRPPPPGGLTAFGR